MSAVVVLVCGLAWGATSWFETAVRQIAALDPTSAAIVDPAAQAGDQNFLVVGSDTRVGAARPRTSATRATSPAPAPTP